jgi:hypothetical protein
MSSFLLHNLNDEGKLLMKNWCTSYILSAAMIDHMITSHHAFKMKASQDVQTNREVNVKAAAPGIRLHVTLKGKNTVSVNSRYLYFGSKKI